MEHTLGGTEKNRRLLPNCVLILVLMEHTLGDDIRWATAEYIKVLILVLMEHTLGDGQEVAQYSALT